MRRTITLRGGCGLLLLLVSACPLAQDKTEGEKSKAERYAKEWKKYIDEQNGNISVSGEVVSSAGERLDGVKVNVDQCIAAGWEDKSVRSTEAVNKTFKFEFKGVQVVYLWFLHDGYHAEQMEFLFGKPGRPTRIEGKTYYYENVRVVLEKIGELARLDEYDLWLKAKPDGMVTVWDTSGVKETKKKTEIKDVQAQNIPAVGVVYACLVPSTGENATTVLGDQVIFPKNKTVRIALNDGADGGFICVPLEGKPARRVMRNMKAAPEAGYQSSFDVTNDDYAKFREGARVCFYFKLNGLYGKGELWSVRYLEETGLDIRIRFRLQPNGTRNVETRE